MSLNTVSYIIEKEVNKVIYSKDINKYLIRDISFLKQIKEYCLYMIKIFLRNLSTN